MGSPFKMIPGEHSGSNKDNGMKAFGQRGLIKDPGPKAYPLANNDPNSKQIQPWETDVDLGGGTLDRQTKLTDVRPVTSLKSDSPNKPGVFTKALENANMSSISPEGGGALTTGYSNMQNRYNKYSNTGDFELMTNSSTNDLKGFNSSSRTGVNNYEMAMLDTPDSARKVLSPNVDTRTSEASHRADFMGIKQPITGFKSFFNSDASGVGDSATSSQFEIGKKTNSGIKPAKITSSNDVADKLYKEGTLDPTYDAKLKAYKKSN